MTREELILELIVQLIQIEGRSGDMNYIRGVANFILSRENLLLEKIGKPLMAFKNRDKTEGKRWGGEIPEIDEALAIIEKESKQ
jgi:hypothetical protein